MSTMSSRFGFSFFNPLSKQRMRPLSAGVSRPENGWIETFVQRGLQRRQLLEVEDCQLMDMGISRAEAEREARKPFWQA